MESRLASLTVDMEDTKKISGIASRSDLPSSFQAREISQMVTTLPSIFNSLQARRAIVPAANGHCSARALARYYAAFVDGGSIPPTHSSSSKPPLGSHPHIPKFQTHKSPKKQKGSMCIQKTDISTGVNYIRVPSDISYSSSNASTRAGYGNGQNSGKLFSNPRIHDEFMGVGEYENLTLPSGEFGLGFKKSYSNDGDLIGFGHSGMGGSTGYCNIEHRFSIAVTLNKMNFGGVTAKILHLVCSELGIPLPAELNRHAESLTNDGSNVVRPMIN